MSGLRLIAAGHTRALRRAVFGGDEDLDEGGLRAALALSPTGVRATRWVSAPAAAARQTARALGGDPADEPALADPDFGRWTGRTPAEVDPDELHTWLSDPSAAPHGGESLTAVTRRAAAWLDRQAGRDLTAVAAPIVVRAVLAAALELAPGGIRRLEVAPLAVTRLTHRGGHWHLHLP